MSIMQQVTLLAVLLLTSKGAAGITGSGFIVLAATLSAVGEVPVAGLALILGIDRFMSEARALTNLVGNAVATLVVARWTGDLNMAQLNAHLETPSALETEAPEVVLDAKNEHMDLSGPATAEAQAVAQVEAFAHADANKGSVTGSPVPVAN